ncbi:MAG: amidohydrolase family protein [Dehalococcoidales bacterium]
MIIDFHTHIFPPQIINNRDYYGQTDHCFGTLYSNPKAKLITAEELIASMDDCKVDISVVQNIGWTTHELCVETNNYILESIQKYPDRLIGFCSVQPLSMGEAIEEINRCAAGGMRGVGELRPDVQMLDIADKDFTQPLADALVKNNMILLTHSSEPVGHQYAGKGTVTPHMLYSLIYNHPELTIVCAHWGGGLPFYALMPEVEIAMENVYFDSAASPFLYKPAIYKQVSAIIGEDKILFGSDYPLMPQSRVIKEILLEDLPDITKMKILGENARNLLRIN